MTGVIKRIGGNYFRSGQAVVVIVVAAVFVSLIVGAVIYFRTKTTSTKSATESEISGKKANVLVLGTVAVNKDEIESKKKEYALLPNYLASKLGDVGITEVKLVMASSPVEMAKFIREGKVDIFIGGPFPSYVVAKLSNSELLSTRWKSGVEKYHSIVFVRADSSIKSLEDLKGKMIAFHDARTTTGYFLPKASILAEGYKLTQKSKSTDSVAADEIGYYFTYGYSDDDNAPLDLTLKKVVTAGAEDESKIRKLTGANFKDLRVILTTPDVIRSLVVYRADIDSKVKKAVTEVLVEMDKSDEGKKVLKSFKDTAKFTTIDPSKGDIYGEIAKLASLVESEIVGD